MQIHSKDRYVRTELHHHVWEDTLTGQFVFEDETNNFNGPYATAEEARQALTAYAEWLDRGTV